MSTAVAEPSRPEAPPGAAAPPPPDPAGGSSTPNILSTALRRWPAMLFGLALGLGTGFLIHIARPPVFQSTGQVLVVKKQMADPTNAEVRTGMYEDIISTQMTFIRSELTMRRAAEMVRPEHLIQPVPDEEKARSAWLGLGFGVARDRDTTIGTGIGSNVMNLSFKAGHPADAQKLLGTVIAAYQEQLGLLYDAATAQKLKSIDANLQAFRTSIDSEEKQLQSLLLQMKDTTHEELTSIKQRLSGATDEERKLKSMKTELEQKLALIKQTDKTDRRKRNLMLIKLGERGEGGRLSTQFDLNSPEQTYRLLEMEKAEHLRKLGVDHPQIQALDAKIKYVRELSAKFSPEDPLGLDLDPLSIHESYLANRLVLTDVLLSMVQTDLAKDNALLNAIKEPQIRAENVQRKIASLINTYQQTHQQKVSLEANKDASGYEAKVITQPSDAEQTAPLKTQSALLGLGLGLVIGLGLAMLAELADKSFRSPAEIRTRLGLPVIGHIPPIREGLPPEKPGLMNDIDDSVVTHYRPRSIEAEAYRGVRTALYFSTQGRGHQLIQVTSPNPGDGKSTLASNLAVSIAQSGKRVILVDCDLRKPRVHKIFHLPKADVGLASVITGEAELAAATHKCQEIDNLYLMPCGPRPGNPAELLTSPKFVEVLAKLKGEYDFVVLDTPPMLAVSDPSVVAPRVDGVLMIFRMTKRAKPLAERAREQLGNLGAKVLGVVVNGTGVTRDGGYDYGYNYSYGYGKKYGYGYSYEYAEEYQSSDEPSSWGDLESPNVPKKG